MSIHLCIVVEKRDGHWHAECHQKGHTTPVGTGGPKRSEPAAIKQAVNNYFHMLGGEH